MQLTGEQAPQDSSLFMTSSEIDFRLMMMMMKSQQKKCGEVYTSTWRNLKTFPTDHCKKHDESESTSLEEDLILAEDLVKHLASSRPFF